ncbi:MAG TPA: substrate-binding domain-containing protein [Candidatus Kapabacteria bacterium]|nr:substrate-binding domain-containing protein [Candidatus Kapabacteria bacterium]
MNRSLVSCCLRLAVAAGIVLAGCEAPKPNVNTPTSGRLIVFVDDLYFPLVKTMSDTFMIRNPNAKVELRPMPARMAVQQLFDQFARDTARTDTSAAYAIVIGRPLLADEQEAIARTHIESKEYLIAYDALAVAVSASSPLTKGTREGLKRALGEKAPTAAMLDTTAAPGPIRFILADQNSSTYSFVLKEFLHADAVAAPARYYSTGDSVVAAVRAGEGLGVIGWWAAQRDSAHVRTLALGFVDSSGAHHPPAIAHPTSLVTDAYPLKMPLMGYSFSSYKSLAIGYLAWLARSQDAQYFLAHQGLQPANVKIRIVMPEHE